MGFWVLLAVLSLWVRGICIAGLRPHVHKARATQVCPSLDTLFGRRPAGGIIFKALWEFTGFPLNVPLIVGGIAMEESVVTGSVILHFAENASLMESAESSLFFYCMCGNTLPPETYAVSFFFVWEVRGRGVISICSDSVWRRKEWLQFFTGWNHFLFTVFPLG